MGLLVGAFVNIEGENVGSVLGNAAIVDSYVKATIVGLYDKGDGAGLMVPVHEGLRLSVDKGLWFSVVLWLSVGDGVSSAGRVTGVSLVSVASVGTPCAPLPKEGTTGA